MTADTTPLHDSEDAAPPAEDASSGQVTPSGPGLKGLLTQKVVRSTGLLERWAFLAWCCPWGLPGGRRSSGVPVIRISRPRSPDSEDEEHSAGRRLQSSGSSSFGSSSYGSTQAAEKGVSREVSASSGEASRDVTPYKPPPARPRLWGRLGVWWVR